MPVVPGEHQGTVETPVHPTAPQQEDLLRELRIPTILLPSDLFSPQMISKGHPTRQSSQVREGKEQNLCKILQNTAKIVTQWPLTSLEATENSFNEVSWRYLESCKAWELQNHNQLWEAKKRSNNSFKSREMRKIQSLTRVHCLHTDWGIAADCEAKAIRAPRDRDLQGDTCQVGEQPRGVIPPHSHTAPQPLEMLAFRDGEGLSLCPHRYWVERAEPDRAKGLWKATKGAFI